MKITSSCSHSSLTQTLAESSEPIFSKTGERHETKINGGFGKIHSRYFRTAYASPAVCTFLDVRELQESLVVDVIVVEPGRAARTHYNAAVLGPRRHASDAS